jgi:L-ascorbate metabolism protein UlaG (beta-lactamase superfamily)
VERDEHGRVKALGYVLQFGDWSLYHSGDTMRYEGMAEKLRPFAVDVALLPINGRVPERRVAGNLSGSEAAQLARDIDAKMAIPCHFEMFEFNTATPQAFVDTCRSLGQSFRILLCGERFDGER